MAGTYVGFANLPNQVHRKSVKKGFEFTLMVVGESGLGKSTLINSLFLTDLYKDRTIPSAIDRIRRTVTIDTSTVEIEERGVKLRLTVVDTPGYGDGMDNQESFKPILNYVNEKFETYLKDESGLNRRNIVDSRVHCCFYFIAPTGRGLKPLDVEFMKVLHDKVNIIPVIGKADTLTPAELEKMKRQILDEIDEYGIKIYDPPCCESDEDEDFIEQTKQLRACVPFAVVGSNTIIEICGKKVRGRLYPWGVVEVENPTHCDFIKLRTMLITHMEDMKEVTHDLHYENFRALRLSEQTGGPVMSPDGPRTLKNFRMQRSKQVNEENAKQEQQPWQLREAQAAGKSQELADKDKLLLEKEAELRRMQDMLSKMQQQIKHQSVGDL